jgi:hypothetical protein
MKYEVSVSTLRRPAAKPAVAMLGVALLSFLTLAAACSSGGETSPDAGGTGGASGAGGGGGAAACDVNMIFMTNCAQSGCHDPSTKFAGLDLTPPVPATRVVGVAPNATSACSGSGKVFINAGSNPATGLMIDNLKPNPACGYQMPFLETPLTPAQQACLQTWANGLTAQ